MLLKKILDFRNSVSFRLTFWYTLVFTIASSAVFILFFSQINTFVIELAEEALVDDVSECRELLSRNGIDSVREYLSLEAETEGSEKIFFRLITDNGDEIAASNKTPWLGLKIDDKAFQKVKSMDDGSYVIKQVALPWYSHKVLVIYARIGDGIILQACHSLDESEEHLDFFANVFTVMMLSVILMASFFGWFMIRRVFSGVSEVTKTAMEIEKGEFERRVIIGKKGSEINDLATAFNKMLDRIDSLIRGMKEISDNIAHDLRSPVTRIRGMAEMALISKSSIDDYREVSSGTIEECDRLLSMINTMLDISETEAGTARFNMTMLNLSEVVEEAIDLFQPMADEKEINVVSRVEGNCLIRGDVPKLQRMVANIIDNAIKYSSVKGTVSVSLTSGDHIEIAVSDSGGGIDEKDLPRIFERFYRADKSRSKTGIGLGLSLARAIARAHGGDIFAISPKDKGCTFFIILPLTSHS